MIETGAATCDITNELGTTIQGATVGGVAKSVRDPLEANALYLSQDGTSVLLVSCDIGGLEPQWTIAAREAIALACNMPVRSVIIGCTHSGGPSVIPTNYLKAIDEAYLSRLVEWLPDLARRAINASAPAQVRYGQTTARIGYNRRCCWADGTHSMFGDTSRDDFVGLEGPDDPTHTVIGVETDGAPIAILHANTAHPCTFYGADFYSADYPGAARSYLRAALGDIPVLFFNGAQGDICTQDITVARPKEAVERQLARLAHILAGETLRLLHECQPSPAPELRHTFVDIEIPVRLPLEEELTWAARILSRVDAGEAVKGMDMALAHGTMLLQERFGANPRDTLPVHAIRLGDLAMVSEPCELFCQYGLDLRRRSPAPMTALLGLADGYHGYCPTPAAIRGGGYSGQPLYWTRLPSETGDMIVDAAACLLHDLWH
jgi:hypothetical protein